jgi:hypothetical protein
MENKPIYNKTDLVCITAKGIEDGCSFQWYIGNPSLKKEFELKTIYTVIETSEYEDGWHVLVEGSTQYIHERYFTFAYPEEKELTNIEYTFVQNYTMGGFIKDVNNYISNGWQLQGGISIACPLGTSVYAQALIKRKK